MSKKPLKKRFIKRRVRGKHVQVRKTGLPNNGKVGGLDYFEG